VWLRRLSAAVPLLFGALYLAKTNERNRVEALAHGPRAIKPLLASSN
jgi:hypothetical protein